MRKSAIIGLAALAAALGIGAVARDASAHSEKESGTLSTTGVDAAARGTAKLQVRNGSDGTFEVKVQRLDSNGAYDVLVDTGTQPQVTGRILTLSGGVVAEATATCLVK